MVSGPLGTLRDSARQGAFNPRRGDTTNQRPRPGIGCGLAGHTALIGAREGSLKRPALRIAASGPATAAACSCGRSRNAGRLEVTDEPVSADPAKGAAKRDRGEQRDEGKMRT